MNDMKSSISKGVKTALTLFFVLGCAHVSIDSKKPIQLNVNMRVDVYQHVAQDAANIEDMISSPKEGRPAENKTSFLSFGVEEVYAQEGTEYPPDVQKAIEGRRDRRDNLISLESKGAIGENSKGYVEVRDASKAGGAASGVLSLVNEENHDRQKIYQYVSGKNGAAPEETGKIFAKRIQADVPSGTPVEGADGNWSIR